jgi:sigma-B regulation protein RsbU (phosphoserine phosphatase)
MGALCAVLVVRTVLVTVNLRQLDHHAAQVSRVWHPASADARAVLTALVNEETGERGYVITGDPEFLGPYRDARTALPAMLADLRRELAGHHELLVELDAVESAVTHWHRVGPRREVAARRHGPPGLAEQLVAERTGKRAFDELRARLGELQGDIDTRLVHAQQQADAAIGTLRTAYDWSAAFLLLTVALGLLAMRRWLIAPIEALRRDLRAIARGDLQRPVHAVGPAEVAAIAADAEAMRRRILAEVDAGRAATEALRQRGPVVVGLRRQLEPSPTQGLQGVDVFGLLQPAEGLLAGDWWDSVRRPDQSTALVVADVAGHGADAGLAAARFKERLTTLLRTELDLLTAFEVAAADLDDRPERLLTCLVVEVRPDTGRLRWLNAGHPSGLLCRREGERVETRPLSATGPLIGISADPWTVEETVMCAHDLLLVFSDGVTEARRKDKEFGRAGVVRTLARLPELAPAVAVTELVHAVRAYADNAQRDDITCAGLRLV